MIPHNIFECQYRQSMYCAVCMSYGHTGADCPNKKAWAIRKGVDASEITNNVMIIKDSPEGVKAVLKSYGVDPGTTRMEREKRLRNLANCLNPPRLILFVEPG